MSGKQYKAVCMTHIGENVLLATDAEGVVTVTGRNAETGELTIIIISSEMKELIQAAQFLIHCATEHALPAQVAETESAEDVISRIMSMPNPPKAN